MKDATNTDLEFVMRSRVTTCDINVGKSNRSAEAIKVWIKKCISLLFSKIGSDARNSVYCRNLWRGLDKPQNLWRALDRPQNLWQGLDRPQNLWRALNMPQNLWRALDRPQNFVAGSGQATEAGQQNVMTMEVLRTADTQEIQLLVYCKVMVIVFETFLGSSSRILWLVGQQ
jgi:hypothetical protein